LGELVKQGRFRKDLYFRINTLLLVTPSLRERKADIPLLAAQLLARIAADLGKGEMHFEDGAIDALRSYSWPGNIRELRNVIERAALFSEGNAVIRSSLRFDPVAAPSLAEPERGLTLAELERQYILTVLDKENGRIEAAAERLGIPRSTLYYKVKQYRLDLSKH
jgi:DNA-binding NtrC family response regulator